MTKRQMRLGTFLSAGDQHVAVWCHPQNRFISGGDFEHYCEALRVVEAA